MAPTWAGPGLFAIRLALQQLGQLERISRKNNKKKRVKVNHSCTFASFLLSFSFLINFLMTNLKLLDDLFFTIFFKKCKKKTPQKNRSLVDNSCNTVQVCYSNRISDPIGGISEGDTGAPLIYMKDGEPECIIGISSYNLKRFQHEWYQIFNIFTIAGVFHRWMTETAEMLSGYEVIKSNIR